MRKDQIKLVSLALIIILFFSCTRSRVKSTCKELINQVQVVDGIHIKYPLNSTLFPVDFQSPTFKWNDSNLHNTNWYTCISDSVGNCIVEEYVNMQEWKPDSIQWETLKAKYLSQKLIFAVIGYNRKSKEFTGNKQSFKISEDSVGADIFFRAVTLPFSYAVRNVNTIEWYMGSVQGGAPKKLLDNMPVCANCHSFSANGPTLAMDVDYGNDKGSYVIANAKDTCSLKPEDIISWSNFKKDEGDPTFGLLSQISPSGKYVLSTVKDLSVFAAVDDNLAYSQLFFPIKGIIGVYNTETKTFDELDGANDPKYVQSNPVWSPDNKKVLFARNEAYINEKVRKYGNALLNINDVKEFKKGNKEFKFDIYSIDFNEGMGGKPEPLKDASMNGKSNYFPKYSPDGKWIVFCQAENFMLLQPDSKLYIMKADGTNARLMNCNTDNMNSWHSWSPNGRWLVFSSKQESLYTRLYLTHIDKDGNDSPPVLLENLVFEKRAANIPEFFPGKASELSKIRDDFSNTAPYFTRLATENIKSQLYIKADQNIKRALAIDPYYIDAYIARILLNSILQQVNSKTEKAEKAKALAIVEDQIDKNKDDLELNFLRANLLSASGNYDQAETILKSLISKSPEFYRAYDLLASVYKKNNKQELVLGVYNKMKSIVPANNLEINLLIAKYYQSNNKIQDALSLLKSLALKYPNDEEVHNNLCNIYISLKDSKAANNEIDFLLKADSNNFSYYIMKAENLELTGKHNEALQFKETGNKLLMQKVESNPENIPLVFEKANILMDKKDYRGASDIYSMVLNKLPQNYQALKEKARISLMLQQWQESIKLYEELLSLYNAEEEFYNNAAIAYIKLGNLEAALNQFTNSLKLNPVNIDALYNRAKLYKMLGNVKKANDDIKNMKQILRSRKNLTDSEKQLLNM